MMLLAPKKPKFTKNFSANKSIKKVINKHVMPRFGSFCIIADELGYITNFQIEGLRRFLRRSFKKRGQLFFRIFTVRNV